LREEALNAAATARFHIAVDGSTTVELVKPTQNPRLNRLLLDTLKHWKFFPAMKDGKPVPSEEVLVIRVLVH
jgi:protein TonB